MAKLPVKYRLAEHAVRTGGGAAIVVMIILAFNYVGYEWEGDGERIKVIGVGDAANRAADALEVLAGRRSAPPDMRRSELAGQNLAGRSFYAVDLSYSDFSGVQGWRDIHSLELANLWGIRNPPMGFLYWAIHDMGAVCINHQVPIHYARGDDENMQEPGWWDVWERRAPVPDYPRDEEHLTSVCGVQ